MADKSGAFVFANTFKLFASIAETSREQAFRLMEDANKAGYSMSDFDLKPRELYVLELGKKCPHGQIVYRDNDEWAECNCEK